MHLPLTFCVFGLLVVALVFLRSRWDGLSPGLRRGFLWIAGAGLLLRGLGLLTNYSVSYHVDAAMYWLCVVGYGVLLVRFSCLEPRWGSSLIAVILAIPVLGASPFLPLTELFDRTPAVQASIGDGLYSELHRIHASPAAVDGAEFDIYSRPAWLPFLRRRRETARLYDTQCNTAGTFAILQPGGRTVRVTCPSWPDRMSDPEHTVVLPLR